ncbi:hypothetical protein PIROE2DRAFT_11622 [Piromyces sp. E2]|nr:hypothetical protein PIROE2DRAFT_11622 [Piromyces sp. E2]|eukprot:OUM62172.1 hypothetical protein PIROE2DRAFT_11622 [Piromyces sp. E2]
MENFTFTFTLDNNNENGEESSTSFRKKDFKATSFTKTREEKQEERRRKLLEEQRQKRSSLVNQARKLIEFSIQNENSENDSDSDIDIDISNQTGVPSNQNNNNSISKDTLNNNQEGMDIDKKTKKNKKNKNKKKINKFKNQLMLSEKLEEIPEDFEVNWIAVKIPDGIPCLEKQSVEGLMTFYSNIPGGNPLSREYQNYSILDCIYNEESNIYYIKDIMCWKGYPTYDCDVEFRFFWIQTKVYEIDLKTCNRYNNYSFIPLPSCYCQPQNLTTFLTNNNDFIGNVSTIVGPVKPPSTILFYNKEAHYILGSTPLCCHLSVEEAKILLHDYCSTMEL